MRQVIDAHAHLGPDRLFGLPPVTGEDLLAAMDRYGIQASLVMPQPGIHDPAAEHTRIAEFAAKHPGRFYGIALPDLRGPEESYVREAERCVRDLGFVAIKFHTAGHSVAPTSALGRLPFETASRLQVPLMVHTGYQVPYALPSLVAARAREYPELKIVLAHAGMAPYAQEALEAARTNLNIYLEASWLPVHALQRAVTEIGPRRIMFGSDIIPNIPVEQAKFAALELLREQEEWCMGRTAATVFALRSVR